MHVLAGNLSLHTLCTVTAIGRPCYISTSVGGIVVTEGEVGSVATIATHCLCGGLKLTHDHSQTTKALVYVERGVGVLC